ncbi:MAG: SAP domain-containing protein [Bacteroidota bacterium]
MHYSQLSVNDFQKRYWYKSEPVQLCKYYKLPAQSTKEDLQARILHFLHTSKLE